MSYSRLRSHLASLPIPENGKKPLRKMESSFFRLRELFLKQREARSLKRILKWEAGYPGVIIFPPTIRWQVPLFQRPHQLAVAFARQGYLVFFCEPFYSQAFSRGFHRIDERLYVSFCPLDVYHSIPKPVVLALAYSRDDLAYFDRPQVIYEYIDELEVLNGDLETNRQDHEFLVRDSAVVIATADRLYQRVKPVRPDALLLPNAVDYEFFRQKIGSTSEPPEDLNAIIHKQKPVVGYYGSLAKWFDYPLLVQVARLRPDLEFVLIGLDYDGSILGSGIEGCGNIHWLGAKPYADLPAYLKFFDVATIPFLINEITQSTSPIKLYEYWAAKKPVVTTPMHECVKVQPLALIASGPEDFICKLDEALRLKDDPDYLNRLEEAALRNTWDERVTSMLAALKGRMSGGAA